MHFISNVYKSEHFGQLNNVSASRKVLLGALAIIGVASMEKGLMGSPGNWGMLGGGVVLTYFILNNLKNKNSIVRVDRTQEFAALTPNALSKKIKDALKAFDFTETCPGRKEIIEFLLEIGALSLIGSSSPLLNYDPKVQSESEASLILKRVSRWENQRSVTSFSREQIVQYSRYPDTAVFQESEFKLQDQCHIKIRQNETKQPFFMNAVGLIFGRKSPIILTQGPICTLYSSRNTIGDFWQLAWETNTPYILNLTDFIENNREKCAQYFPDEEMDEINLNSYGFYIKKTQKPNYSLFGKESPVYKLQITKFGDTKQISLIHVKSWKDQSGFSVKEAYQLVKFLADKNEERKPIIVHCSAGMGRSGIFAGMYLIFLIIEDAFRTNQSYRLNFENLTKLLRCPPFGREGAIQTVQQFLMLEAFAVHCWEMKIQEEICNHALDIS